MQYTLDLLKEIGKTGCKPMATPIEANNKLNIKDETLMSEEGKGKYQCLIGKLIYLTLTKPDITYIVKILVYACTHRHSYAGNWKSLCYLKRNPSKGPLYISNVDQDIEGY